VKSQLAPIIFITGTDGAGKSCLAEWLVEHLETNGINAKRVWSRFNNFISKPLLALTRISGHNYFKEVDGTLFGFHDFERLRGYRSLFAILQAIDVNIAAARDISRIRNRNGIIVCERGPWDTLVDVISDTGLNILPTSRLGKIFTAQVRSNSGVFLISRSVENILQTRPDLIHDHKLERKYHIYHEIAGTCGWEVIDNNNSLTDTKSYLLNYLFKCYGIKIL